MQAPFQPADFFCQFLHRLGKTRLFFGYVDQPRQWNGKGRPVQRQRDRPFGCGTFAKAVNPRQAADQRVVAGPSGAGFGRKGGGHDVNLQASRHMHLGAGGSDFVDQGGHKGHLAVGFGGDQVGAVGWPIGMHQQFGALACGAPKLFGDKRHDGMQKDHRLIQHPSHGRAGFSGGGAIKQGFGEFDIPVANLAPDEFIKRVGCGIKAVVFQGGVHLGQGFGRFADDPQVGGGCHLRRGALGFVTFPHAVHLGKAAGVPQFGAKVAIARDALGIHLERAAEGGHRRIGKAQRICAEFVDDL